MKGLILKDFYMASKYCRAFLVVIVVFLAVSFAGDGNAFFNIYPMMFAGILPVTLISYDEREKWNIYSGTLPYSREQLVSSKYLIGLCFEAVVFVVSAIAQAFRMISTGSFSAEAFSYILTAFFALGMIAPSVLLPFIFKFGAEKGRVAFYIVIAVLGASSTVLAGLGIQTSITLDNKWILPLVWVAVIALYLFSWFLSVQFYKKREL